MKVLFFIFFLLLVKVNARANEVTGASKQAEDEEKSVESVTENERTSLEATLPVDARSSSIEVATASGESLQPEVRVERSSVKDLLTENEKLKSPDGEITPKTVPQDDIDGDYVDKSAKTEDNAKDAESTRRNNNDKSAENAEADDVKSDNVKSKSKLDSMNSDFEDDDKLDDFSEKKASAEDDVIEERIDFEVSSAEDGTIATRRMSSSSDILDAKGRSGKETFDNEAAEETPKSDNTRNVQPVGSTRINPSEVANPRIITNIARPGIIYPSFIPITTTPLIQRFTPDITIRFPNGRNMQIPDRKPLMPFDSKSIEDYNMPNRNTNAYPYIPRQSQPFPTVPIGPITQNLDVLMKLVNAGKQPKPFLPNSAENPQIPQNFKPYPLFNHGNFNPYLLQRFRRNLLARRLFTPVPLYRYKHV